MELFFGTLGLLLVAVLIILSHRGKSDYEITPSYQVCEMNVSRALRSMDVRSYVIFDNLVLRSDGNTAHTEIDHVVVSPYGIFCIETKSHRGAIYGYTQSGEWKQYLSGKRFDFYNPHRQNYKHVEALRMLIGDNLRAPIHSYVVFPNARTVKVDGEYIDASIEAVVSKIENHKTPVYDLHDCERILRTLAFASSKHEELIDTHVNEVQAYIDSLSA